MLEAGDKVNGYTLKSHLGNGNYGEVWLAEQSIQIAAKSVLRALKFLSGRTGKSVDIKGFQHEVATWCEASGHSNVITVIDAFEAEGRLVIVSEYAPGGSLRDWLESHGEKAPPLENAAEMTIGILTGLAYLHSRNITHRDLKPENILLQHDTPKITDFGISRIVENITRSLTLAGSPAYMAPEAYDKSKNPMTDLWSVGVILYEMLSGKLPFNADDHWSLGRSIKEEDPAPLPLAIPEEFRKIVIKALQKPLDQRFKTAAEMRDTLNKALLNYRYRTAKLKETIIDEDWQSGLNDSEQPDKTPAPNVNSKGHVKPLELSQIQLKSPSSESQNRIRIYDLAREVKQDTKRVMEELRREGADVSVPSNSVSKELADRIRSKYFPKDEKAPARTIKIKKPFDVRADAEEKELITVKELATVQSATQQENSEEIDFGAILEQFEQEQNSAEIDYGAILEQFEQEQTAFSSGELVRGKVVGISLEQGILVDFGYRHEGIIAPEEFMSPEGEITIKQGNEIEAVIKSMDSGNNPPYLSYLDAVRRRSWVDIEQAYRGEKPIKVRITDKTKGGLKADINGVEAFLPGSQIDSRPVRNLDSYLGQELEAKIIKFSRKRNNIVLSRKVLTDEIINKQKSETLNRIQEGVVVDGKVKSLTEYGAFVDIGGIDGLLHVTDMSWGRLGNPNQMFKVGDTAQVKVLKLDREKEKISLGYKQLVPDPWATVGEIYPIGSKIKGKVSSVTEYGAFVELEPGVEGLVHVSEMSWSRRTKSPPNLVHPGDEIEVQVLAIDTKERRISLGMKQIRKNPWDTIGERYNVGDKVKGKVRNMTDFGAFVEIEPGVDGLVHLFDISHSKKIKHPKDILKKDDEVEAVITNIDTRGHRLSLSIKELTPSAWEVFVATHKTGDVVRGKISRFAGFGVFVELGDELEGLCHISELSNERVNRAEDIVQIGQEIDFKILRIEMDVQKIGLSHRAIAEDEAANESWLYSVEEKRGMSSLAELANLKFGRDEADSSIKEDVTKADTKMSSVETKGGMTSLGELANLKFGRDAEDDLTKR